MVATELLYGLAHRDRDGITLMPGRVRRLVTAVPPDCRSLLPLAGDAEFEATMVSNVLGVFRSIVTHLGRAHAAFAGIDPTLGDVWNPALVGL
ncbi:hypothetical protein ACFXO9_31585 [Nocardia tengchongensis]|uniref:hypothetical protein n=1 Tax=Nocardia tengchongensis TaxID=2055889 RepID=UPI0036C61093